MKCWLGRAEAKPADDAPPELAGVGGAIVNVIALAESRRAFRCIVRDELREIGLDLLSLRSIEDVTEDNLEDRSQEIQEARKQISIDNPLVFSTFFTYPKEDIDEFFQ